jgi:hypothetical protein
MAWGANRKSPLTLIEPHGPKGLTARRYLEEVLKPVAVLALAANSDTTRYLAMAAMWRMMPHVTARMGC